MPSAALPERVRSVPEPLSAADLRRLQDALDRLLQYEKNEWPTREHCIYIQQLEHLRQEIAKRIPPP